jgi:hypothetical protein
MTANQRTIAEVLAAIEAAAQESRRVTLAQVARAGRLTDEELRGIEDAVRRAEMMGRDQASALDARDELRAVRAMVLTLLTEIRRLRTLIAARNIEGENAALAAEEAL